MKKTIKAAKIKPAVRARVPEQPEVTSDPLVVESEPHTDEPEACGNCFAWRDSRCKRFPPAKVPGEQISSHRVYTAATDWCGEYRRV